MITDNKLPIKRYSWQREAILDVVRDSNVHPTAEWVYNQIRTIIPNISLGTVYRNLQQLSEAGLIRTHQFETGKMRYDGKIDHHFHFICESCNRIEDHVVDDLESQFTELMPNSSAQVNHSELYLYGICETCTKKGALNEC